MPKKKKVPNPGGKHGGEIHRNFVNEVFDTLLMIYKTVQKEFTIKLKNGKKRFADVASVDENGNPIEVHQVGRTNKNGTPVARERRAIEDIEKTTGLKVIFHALPFVAVFFIVLYFVAKFV